MTEYLINSCSNIELKGKKIRFFDVPSYCLPPWNKTACSQLSGLLLGQLALAFPHSSLIAVIL